MSRPIAMTAMTIHARGERNIRRRFMTCLVRLEIREILLPRLSFASKLAGASREPGCHQICSGAPIASVGTHIVEGRTVTFVPRSGPTYSVGTHVLWRNLRPLSGPTYSVGTYVCVGSVRSAYVATSAERQQRT